ncbi:MAG: pyridoxamine 5'-phosphate oxidase [Bacteroidetes bacterium]|nr:pyridoxamine 5'-phosphate oxidase [Bacteroidota bacterium]MCH8033290.1 pyridoxamine 5'-phosphate oxidase [Bacteroidota bacterium]
MNSTNVDNGKKYNQNNELNETSVNKNPFIQFIKWYESVLNSNLNEPTAMMLSTADVNGNPSARIVLLKEIDDSGFVFYTNYESRKGKDLKENPKAALTFFWDELRRQIRIEGRIEKISRETSKEYFSSRLSESQIGAWVSAQSTVIQNREFLENKFDELKEKFGNEEIPLPDFWGGYRLIPNYFEFWQGRENRLHDRICYKKENDEWKIFRLAP